MTTQRVKILRIGDHDHPFPARASAAAAGLDLRSRMPYVLEPMERVLVPTGFAFELRPGTYGRIAPRSGLANKHGIDVLAGVIDADYRGEIHVLLINLGDQGFIIKPGDRIAQLIISPIETASVMVSDQLGVTGRGAGGFGSTGTE